MNLEQFITMPRAARRELIEDLQDLWKARDQFEQFRKGEPSEEVASTEPRQPPHFEFAYEIQHDPANRWVYTRINDFIKKRVDADWFTLDSMTRQLGFSVGRGAARHLGYYLSTHPNIHREKTVAGTWSNKFRKTGGGLKGGALRVAANGVAYA